MQDYVAQAGHQGNNYWPTQMLPILPKLCAHVACLAGFKIQSCSLQIFSLILRMTF